MEENFQINQQLEQQLKQNLQHYCDKGEEHKTEILSFICIDKRCLYSQQYLSPMCVLCQTSNIHNQQDHRQVSLRQFLKNCKTNPLDEQNSYQNNNKNHFQKEYDIATKLSENQKKLLIIRSNIDSVIQQIDKDIHQIDETKKEFTQQIDKVIKSPSLEKLQENLQLLSKEIKIDENQDQQQQYQINQDSLTIDQIEKKSIIFQSQLDNLMQLSSKFSQDYKNPQFLQQKQPQFLSNELKYQVIETINNNQNHIRLNKQTDAINLVLSNTQISQNQNFWEIEFCMKIEKFKDHIYFGLIDIEIAQKNNFNFSKQYFGYNDHGIYGINDQKQMFSSSDWENNAKKLSKIDFKKVKTIYCKCDYSKGTLVFSSKEKKQRGYFSWSNSQVENEEFEEQSYEMKFDNSSQKSYHPFIGLFNKGDEVLFTSTQGENNDNI